MSEQTSKAINKMMEDNYVKGVPYEVNSKAIMDKYSELELLEYVLWSAQNPDTDEHRAEVEALRTAYKLANELGE